MKHRPVGGSIVFLNLRIASGGGIAVSRAMERIKGLSVGFGISERRKRMVDNFQLIVCKVR